MDTLEKRKYAKCLLVALNPSSPNLNFSIKAHRGDALCIVEGDQDRATTLGGRQVDSHHVSTNIIKEWIPTCSQLHGVDCSPMKTQDLREVRLVDVFTRQVVKYPANPCDYQALSYVWGGVA
jgi:hypothetical protein